MKGREVEVGSCMGDMEKLHWKETKSQTDWYRKKYMRRRGKFGMN
jgi:hypothetical protein